MGIDSSINAVHYYTGQIPPIHLVKVGASGEGHSIFKSPPASRSHLIQGRQILIGELAPCKVGSNSCGGIKTVTVLMMSGVHKVSYIYINFYSMIITSHNHICGIM